jgi:outer membrane scaffolding protein for murein synthesis (MipA/OmpV family)
VLFRSGRQESSSPDLAGLGDVRRTLRARLGTSYRLDDGWRVGSSITVDALGRDGGTLGDLSAGRDVRLAPNLSLGIGATLTFGDARYLQSYFGITPEQAARSGYREYAPGAGLRDVGFGVGLRGDLGQRWVLFGGASVSRLLGPAADSPLTRRADTWGLNAGVVYRF